MFRCISWRNSKLTGPKGQKHPADVIGKAVKVLRIVTGLPKDRGYLANNFKRKHYRRRVEIAG